MAVPDTNAPDKNLSDNGASDKGVSGDDLSVKQTDVTEGEAAQKRTDPQLLSLLVCPQTRTALIWDASASELISLQARLAYPVQDGVPRLLVEIARPLTDEDMRKWRKT